MSLRKIFLSTVLLSEVSAQAQTTNRNDSIMALQQSSIQQLQKRLDALTQVDGVPVPIAPIAFKKSLYVYSTPLVIPSNGGVSDHAVSFDKLAVLSENNWDWNAQSDVWTYPANREKTKVYARLTFSLTSSNHWSPCFVLRRRNLSSGTLKTMGRTIELPCVSHIGRRETKPASMTVWVEWWNDNMPLEQNGQPSQTFEIAGRSYGASGSPAGWTLHGLEIELYKATSP